MIPDVPYPRHRLAERDGERVKRLRKAAFERQGGLCHWCGTQMIYKTQQNAAKVWDHPRVCTADHVIWRAKGGKTTEENIVAACLDCNTKRHPPPLDGGIDWPWLRKLQADRVRQVGWGPWHT